MAASGDDGLHVGAGDVRFTDASDVTTTLASGTTGVDVQVDANPADGDPLFRVLSASGGQRLRVEHDGETYTDNDFRASGSITGASLSVTGTATIDGLTTHNGDVDLTTSSMTFTDSANANADVLLTANDPDHPDEGLSVRTLSNPANGEPIFRVLSSGGHERFRVEHEGETFVDQDLAASGTITGGNVSTTGTVTFGALSGFSHSGVYNAEIEADNSTTGTQTDTTNMLSTSISVCFVSSTFLQDIEGDTEGAGCRVYRSNGTWVLEASVVSGTAHDAHATCQGRCLRWD